MTTYKIESDRPDLAMRVLLRVICDHPEMEIGASKGTGLTWNSTTTPKKFSFWVYRTKTMWVITQEHAIEAGGIYDGRTAGVRKITAIDGAVVTFSTWDKHDSCWIGGHTMKLAAFARWAKNRHGDVTYPGSNGRCVADKLSVAIGAVAPCDCGKCAAKGAR